MNMPEFETQAFSEAKPLVSVGDPGRPDVAAPQAAVPSVVRRATRLHRLREVRHEQGIAAKRAAQLMGTSVEQLRAEEEPDNDLTLSRLYEWQRLLEVPVEDLLVEPHAPLSEPVLKRARMLRLMKTAQAIMERAHQSSVRRLAQTMINQLIEIMPELEGVTPWHQADRPRSQDQNSRILESSYLNEARPD